MAEVSSIEARGDLVIDSPVANEGDGWAGSGANPWRLDEETESVLFLTNMADKDVEIGFQVQAGGVSHYLTDLSLKPRETRAIDLRQLRDAQEADFLGNKIPAAAAEGAVHWVRLDNLPVMGRVVVLERRQRLASSYACGSCLCPPNLQTGMINDPGTWSMLPTQTKQLTCTAQYKDCNGLSTYYNRTTSSAWTSYNQPVATVNDTTQKGLVTGVAGGSAEVKASFNGNTWYYNTYTHVCVAVVICAVGGTTANVCSLGITDPPQGTLYSLGESNYNRATVPLNATSSCSGTANWTFNYSYTSQRPITYTSSSTTSSTIGQTSNYQSPAGNGGQVGLEARATLAGQLFTANRTIYIDGVAIPDATITNRLVGLYTSGATPRLLTGIASKESSYRQFAVRNLYGVSGRWPLESPDPSRGLYVGLMQVPNGMVNAFDWLTNSQQGANILQTKLTQARNDVASLRAQYPSLPEPSGTQYEDNALILYGGWFNLGGYYWVPNGTFDGWIQTSNNPGGVNYVNDVRSRIQ